MKPDQRHLFKAFESIRICQSMQRDRSQFPTIALHWLVDSNIFKCFKFLWAGFLHRSRWESILIEFRLTFLGEGMGTSLIDWLLVFLRCKFQWFGVSSSLTKTGSPAGGLVLPALSIFFDSLTVGWEKIWQKETSNCLEPPKQHNNGRSWQVVWSFIELFASKFYCRAKCNRGSVHVIREFKKRQRLRQQQRQKAVILLVKKTCCSNLSCTHQNYYAKWPNLRFLRQRGQITNYKCFSLTLYFKCVRTNPVLGHFAHIV